MAMALLHCGPARGHCVPLLARVSVRHFVSQVAPDAGMGAAAVSSSASVPSSESGPLATTSGSALSQPGPRSRASDIGFKGPIMEDLEGGARYADSIGKFYNNVPLHVQKSFRAPNHISEAPRNHAPLLLDGLANQAKALVASTGWAPQAWSQGQLNTYYGGNIALAPYSKGQTAAYNYPDVLVPRELAHRFPLDMWVDPLFVSSDHTQQFRQRSRMLFPMLQNHSTLLIIFSGQPLSGLFTGLRRWVESVDEDFRTLPKTQVLKLHCAKGWFSRRTSFLTKFQLRRQVEEDELFKTFIYRGKWKFDYERSLHLYDKELPVVLLIDPVGYIRWHAVGLPTEEATDIFRSVSSQMAREKSKSGAIGKAF